MDKTIDNDYKYLMECDLNENNSKSDSIRSKIFQINALKNEFKSNEFNKLSINLMNALSEEIDRKDGKNSYLNESMLKRNASQRSQKTFEEWKSNLYELNGQQLCQTLNLKMKDNNSVNEENIGIILKTKLKNDGKCVDRDVGDCDQKVVKTNIFNKVGSFAKTTASKPLNNISEPNGSQTRTNSLSRVNVTSSPTRVSGIFKSNGNNSPKNVKNDDNYDCEGTQPKRSAFMTGLERKLVNEVKNGTIGANKAKKVLVQTRQPFRNPLKTVVNKNIEEQNVDQNLKNVDQLLIEQIENEIISNVEPIGWSQIAGLDYAKNKINEIAVLPLRRPELFRGIRNPPKGILLFGPPGTGKTLIGRCIASQTKSTFFSITVSTLTSKWVGEGEKLIRAMFCVARSKQPSVIFIDEIDSLLKTRCDSEHESSRRMKTEFLAQFEGVATHQNDRLLIIGATNRPQELDDAARRRLTARLYIRLPDVNARKQMITNCISIESVKHCLTDEQIDDLAQRTDGYSGADMRELCRESAMESFRDPTIYEKIDEIDENEIRNITYEDFLKNLNVVKPTVSTDDLQLFEEWNKKFGTNDFK